jgi:hypothetical protein
MFRQLLPPVQAMFNSTNTERGPISNFDKDDFVIGHGLKNPRILEFSLN